MSRILSKQAFTFVTTRIDSFTYELDKLVGYKVTFFNQEYT